MCAGDRVRHDMSHEDKASVLRTNMNCPGTNHFVKQSKSAHKCKVCRKLHHTLLHVDGACGRDSTSGTQTLNPAAPVFPTPSSINSTPAEVTLEHVTIVTNTAIKLGANNLSCPANKLQLITSHASLVLISFASFAR